MTRQSRIETFRAFRERVLARQPAKGAFMQADSSIAMEIASMAGYDWLLVDLEHGHSDQDRFVSLLQGIGNGPAVPLVRVAFNDLARVKRALDMGVAGVMFPSVHSSDEARGAVAAMRYPPEGLRGVATATRASDYGAAYQDCLDSANRSLLTIVQIESPQGVAEVEAISKVEGVDMLFVGPVDLSVSLGVPMQFDHPTFLEARQKTVEAAKANGKVLGTLCFDEAQAREAAREGFSFISLGSDIGVLRAGLTEKAAALGRAFED